MGYLAWSDATAVHGAEQTWAAMLADVQACEAQPPLDAAYESGYRFMVLNGTRPSGEQRDDMVLLLTADLDGQITMSRLMAQAEALGAFLAWPQMTVPLDRGLELPLYPFERSHYWFAGSTSHQQTLLAPRDFGLDGARLDFPGQDLKILHTLSAENFAEAADNSGAVHLGYFVEMLARAVAPVLPVETAFSIRWMDLLKAIIVPPDTPIEVLISLPAAVTEGAFAIHARLASETDWSLVARGELGAVHGDAPQEPLGAYRERMAAMTQEQFYSALELERGFYFGPAVRAVEQAWSGESAGVLRLEVAAGTPRRPFYTMGFHPGFVDACAQACNRFSMDSTPREQKYMVQRLEEVTLWSGPSTADVNSPRMGVVDVTGVSDDLQSISATFSITDQVGSVQLRVGLVRLKAFDEEKLAMLAGARRETSLGPDQLLLARFQRASQTGKVDLILNLLIELLTDILSLGPEEVLASTPMRDFGLDSMTGMDLYTQVADRTGSPLTFTDLLEAENLAALAHDVAQAMQRNPQETRGEESTDLSTGTWLRGFEPAPTEARVRLLCFPNGYRSADMFDEWQDILGPEIQVVGVMLPGIDGTRLRERPPVLIDEISKTIETVIAEPLADLPVATYGHSWGS
ncbi:MAG: polyketide synthase dehydratase domain-containing protein, partial [Cutibacterium avidum]|nr:polyketide synthase dehydratase domain-containing protein [Cutibacterium avidum]